MNITYTDLLGNSRALFDDQPREIKETIRIINEYQADIGVKEVIDCLQKQEIRYTTYTHN